MILKLLKYIILAVVQGISEVLPISSSGHIIIFQNIFNLDTSNLSTAIFLHIGSLLAVVVFYYAFLKQTIKNSYLYCFKKERNNETKNSIKLIINLLISIIPAGIVGLLFKQQIESIFSTTLSVGICLIVTGILLLILTRKSGTKTINDITPRDALIIGLFQAIGVLPGVSRSGITTIGGKVSKLKSEDAINYAFLLFIPIALGTGVLEVVELINGKLILSEQELVLNLIGVIVSFIVTYFALKWILKLIKKGKLHYFSFYCFLIGIAAIIMFFIK